MMSLQLRGAVLNMDKNDSPSSDPKIIKATIKKNEDRVI